MKIFLPWPPSANKIWRNLRGSRGLYLAKEYKRFVDESKIWLWKQGSPRVLGDENLEVVIKLYPPTKRGYDVDNRIKPTLDALTKVGFWRDDKIARKVTAIACDPIPGGGAVVEIYKFSPLDERSPTREFATFRRGVRGAS
ncbi:MAG: RusA family crossover junction endodeoxyribonuclease [Thermoguttaceae bacterium]|jgi:Holliday junction resolvase RusA-like endonuclease|nr:RusA family crossover junction endodeoxyribonuclease [Thermoguttaceae bacterium]MBQ9127617.1 RusA family crossover junction endodeoxyribonuclease [Thermoguttaceae bacterium]